ncbi:MAG TPA: response regulator [Blastocatellia bacterium]|nr:response regulator [Blastocatellia bacterium]
MSAISILVVEDDRDIRELITFILQIENFDVQSAADGREAIRILDQYTPNVLVTDLNMPHVSGIELIEHVRHNTSNPDLPIIVMTAFCGKPVDEAQSAGASIVLQKPVDHEMLLASIKWLTSEALPSPSNVYHAADIDCMIPAAMPL